MRDQRRRGGALRTATAFGVGATLGSIVALLYAPTSGKATRRRLAMKAKNFQKAAIRRIGRTQRVLANRAESAREAATEWITDHMPHQGNGNRHRVVRHA